MKQFIKSPTKQMFETALAADTINTSAIAYIEDVELTWVQNKYYQFVPSSNLENVVLINRGNKPIWTSFATVVASQLAASATKLSTARTITIGNTSKNFDGTANVSWSLAEIGAAAASHTHSQYIETPSDRRIKENILDISEDNLDSLDNINYKQFTYINSSDTVYYGVIAQDVLELGIPNIVGGSEEKMYTVNYNNLFILEIQKLKKQIKELQEQVKSLINVVSELS